MRSGLPTTDDILRALGIAVFVSSLAACGPALSDDWQSQLGDCPTVQEMGRLEPFDRFNLRVYGEDAMTGDYEVSPSGTIQFPLLGEIAVAGKRCDELESELIERLGKEVLREPSVVCVSQEVQRNAITVQGQVRRPGVMEFRPGLMLTDAIANSEGLGVRAVGNRVVITRKRDEGGTRSIVVPYEDILNAEVDNICLHPGDIIFVPETVL